MGTKAEAIRAALEVIANANDGRLRPVDVVDAARDAASVLHDQFEWSDAKAADEHRISQARSLIRAVRVQFTVETRVIDAPYYVRDPNAAPDEQGYAALPRLLSDKDAARRAVIREFTVAEGALERARAVAAVLNQDEAVDSLAVGLRAFREDIQAGSESSPA